MQMPLAIASDTCHHHCTYALITPLISASLPQSPLTIAQVLCLADLAAEDREHIARPHSTDPVPAATYSDEVVCLHIRMH